MQDLGSNAQPQHCSEIICPQVALHSRGIRGLQPSCSTYISNVSGSYRKSQGLKICESCAGQSRLKQQRSSGQICRRKVNQLFTHTATSHTKHCTHSSLQWQALRNEHFPHAHQVDTRIRAAAPAADKPVGNRGPPGALVKVASAFLYIVPWIDILSLGREVYHFFPTSLVLYLLPGGHPNPSCYCCMGLCENSTRKLKCT